MTLTLEEIRNIDAAVRAACEGTPAAGLAPNWEDSVPGCSTGCRHYDGRWCSVAEAAAGWLCEPAVVTMARLVLAGRGP